MSSHHHPCTILRGTWQPPQTRQYLDLSIHAQAWQVPSYHHFCTNMTGTYSIFQSQGTPCLSTASSCLAWSLIVMLCLGFLVIFQHIFFNEYEYPFHTFCICNIPQRHCGNQLKPVLPTHMHAWEWYIFGQTRQSKTRQGKVLRCVSQKKQKRCTLVLKNTVSWSPLPLNKPVRYLATTPPPAETWQYLATTTPAQTWQYLATTTPAQTWQYLATTTTAQTWQYLDITTPAQTWQYLATTTPAQTWQYLDITTPAQTWQYLATTTSAQTWQYLDITTPAQTWQYLHITSHAQTGQAPSYYCPCIKQT